MSEHNGKYNGNGHDPEHNPPDNVVRMPTLAERDRLRRDQAKSLPRDANNPATGPAINLPPVTKFMMAALILPFLILELALDPPTKFMFFEIFGFKPSYYTGYFPGWPAFCGPFTYIFLHGSWMHIAMNVVMLAAFGAGAEKWMGGKRLLLLFFASSLGACLFHFILSPGSDHSMIGASGGVSGLFAAVMVMLQQQGRLPYSRYGLLPLAALWVAISFIFGMLGGPDGSSIAWAAHIGGFLVGLALIKPVMRLKL